MPFLDELTALDPARIRIRPYDQYGFPSGADLLEYASTGATVYCCAPAPLIASVRRDLPASAAEAVHFERFSAPPVLGGQPFEVALTRSNRGAGRPGTHRHHDDLRVPWPRWPDHPGPLDG